ncbi:MAG: DUF5020 family protein [Bacteroidales bacterium]|nr:DUF5020 family protein [Bacteroidales bacterium]
MNNLLKTPVFAKKSLFFVFCLSPFFLEAQNFQVHYDFGEGRNYVTTTFEMFKPDKIGNTFIFVDFDFNFRSKTSLTNGTYYNPGLAYMEVARCFSLSKKVPISAQIEYNGGLFMTDGKGLAINNAFLVGLDYFFHSKDYTRVYNIKALYKYIMGKEPASFQITAVWTINWWQNRFTFSGFADFWYERNTNYFDMHANPLEVPTTSKFVFIAEPQLWWNIRPCIAVGTEIEMSVNFSSVKGFKCCPTVAAKYTF